MFFRFKSLIVKPVKFNIMPIKKYLEQHEIHQFNKRMKFYETQFPQWVRKKLPDLDSLPMWQQKEVFNLYRRSHAFEMLSTHYIDKYKKHM